MGTSASRQSFPTANGPWGGSLNGTLDALAAGASGTVTASDDDEGASPFCCLGGGPAAGTAAGEARLAGVILLVLLTDRP